jgi:PAS domain S-box-containing protein
MNEIAKLLLENEMAHKQSMRLAELSGLSIAAQTTFATAVSEISRGAMNKECHPVLTLNVSDKKQKIKYIIAVLEDKRQAFSEATDEGYKYAKKLVANITASSTAEGTRIELNYRLPATLRIDDKLVEKWTNNLNADPTLSPYEEIKRKNLQLIEMADKLRESEQQYKTLTNSLPIMIFSVDNNGAIIFANQWMHEYTGETIDEINRSNAKNIIHTGDFNLLSEGRRQFSIDPDAIIIPEHRIKNAGTGEYKWHTGISIAIKDPAGAIKYRNTFLVDIHAQKVIEETLKDNRQLKETQRELEEKIMLLNQSNQQLAQFAYVASHDLQEPLRKISFYSDFLSKKFADKIPEQANFFFNSLINAADRMKILIQDILAYSTVREEKFEQTDLNETLGDVLLDLEISIKEKKGEIIVGKLPVIEGNPRQLKQLFENLLSNSLKFSKPNTSPVITVSANIGTNTVLISFTDNGIGFDNRYMSKMFDIFQRLDPTDRKGTGIGLAICKKIADIHHGSISAVGEEGVGASFLIDLPLYQGNIDKIIDL